MTQQKKMSVFKLLLFLSQNRRSIMLPMPLLRNMQMALQHINHVSGATMLDIMMRPHRYQLTEQRWSRCGCCKKARCPAVQSVFCLCDILDCSLSVDSHIFYHDNKPSFVVAAAFSTRPLYCRPVSPHSAEGLTPSSPFIHWLLPAISDTSLIQSYNEGGHITQSYYKISWSM